MTAITRGVVGAQQTFDADQETDGDEIRPPGFQDLNATGLPRSHAGTRSRAHAFLCGTPSPVRGINPTPSRWRAELMTLDITRINT